MMNEAFKSRKFITLVLILAGGTYIFLFTEKDLTIWQEFVAWIYGLYVTSNVGQKAFAKPENLLTNNK